MKIPILINFDTLFNAMFKCKKGVNWKDSVASFTLRGVERVMKLLKDLSNNTYTPSKVKKFTITSPKKREIASISFRDRVFQRCLNDEIVYPTMTKSFIYDNYACQKGKGTDAARSRLKYYLRSYFLKYGNDGYVAQFDIKGYYPNMDHRLVEDMFERKLSEDSYEIVKSILSHQYEGDKGYNPGSQLVQIAGISFLDKLDHYIKEKLHIHYYIRYMDDFILIHNDKEYLKYCKDKIEEYLHGIKFDVNPKKTKIYHISDGIEFLGFKYKLTKTGKALMFVKSDKVKSERRKLLKMAKLVKEGKLNKDDVDRSYNSWRSYIQKGNTYNLTRRMDKFYSDLWKEM